MQYLWWFGLVVGLVVTGYFWLEINRWQRRLIDFQGSYHKTMTPLQIRRSRRTFFKSEVRKSPRLQRLSVGARICGVVGLIGLITIIAQLGDSLVFTTHVRRWLAVTFGVVTIAGSGWLWLERLIAAQLYELTALAEDAPIVDLSATPRQFGQAILRSHRGLAVGIAIIGLLLVVGSLQGRFEVGLLGRGQSAAEQTSYGSTASQEGATAAQSSSATSTPASGYQEPRVNRDPAYVRTLAPKSGEYVTMQDQVGLLAMYYLAYLKAPADGLENNPGIKYEYHIIQGRQPLTIVVKSNSPKQPFVFMAEIKNQGELANQRVRMFKFTANTPSALNGLVPTYQEFPDSSVKMGQLLHAYYSDEDGPYHRTMWAMAPGEDWQYQ